MLQFSEICIERPVGTNGNTEVMNSLSRVFDKLHYKTIELPFDCTVWQPDNSFVEKNGKKINIFSSPFSKSVIGTFSLQFVRTQKELESIQDYNGVLVFAGELSKSAKMPKDFPFYFPEEDKLLYETLERINPKAVIAITGQDASSGLNPFPLFEDTNLAIPTAYTSSLDGITDGDTVSLRIISQTSAEKSKQLVFRKEGESKEIILITAHMDTKYGTNGALDNASGVYALAETADFIHEGTFKYTIEMLPFNGEESPEVPGQLAYLNYLQKNNYTVKAVINIDGAGHIGSKNMLSFFNFDEQAQTEIIGKNNVQKGEAWYSGDHAMFAFQNIPCIAITSSDIFTDANRITHTKNDLIECVDLNLLYELPEIIGNVIGMIQ